MKADLKTFFKRSAKWLVVIALILILSPLLAQLLGIAIGLSITAVGIVGYAIFLIGMPLFFWILAEAGYKVFLKPSIRAIRIRKIRDRRLLKEAAARSNMIQ